MNMNFWRSFGFYTPSPIDNILEKDSFELEELLDEDDIVRELNSHNKNLLNYLSNSEVLEKVVRYVVTNGQVEFNGEPLPEAKQRKYTNVCTEILSLESFSIADGICENPQLIDALYGFLEGTPPLKSQVATHGSRILGSLLQQKPRVMIEFLRRKESAAHNLIRHLGSSPVMELLLTIIRCDDTAKANGVTEGTVQWLKDANIIPSIVELLSPENPEHVHECASETLISIIMTSARPDSPLVLQLQSEEVISQLFTHTMSEISVDSSSLRNGIAVITALVSQQDNISHDDEYLPPSLRLLQQHLPALKDLLDNRQGKVIQTTFGQLSSPLGPVRLKVLELIFSVVRSRFESLISRTLIDAGLFRTCLDLFFYYEWNNILHRIVADITLEVLSGSDLELKIALFERADLHIEIAKHAVEQNEQKRSGYMGFVTIIANAIENEAKDIVAISEKLEQSPEWKHFVETELQRTRSIIEPSSGNNAHKPSSSASTDDDDSGWFGQQNTATNESESESEIHEKSGDSSDDSGDGDGEGDGEGDSDSDGSGSGSDNGGDSPQEVASETVVNSEAESISEAVEEA